MVAWSTRSSHSTVLMSVFLCSLEKTLAFTVFATLHRHGRCHRKKKKKRSPNFIVPIHNTVGCECIVIIIVKPTTLSFYFIFVIHLHILVLINFILIIHHPMMIRYKIFFIIGYLIECDSLFINKIHGKTSCENSLKRNT